MLALVENYIYFYHLDTYCVLPQFPESINDSTSVNFNSSEILGRSAPIYTFSSSGPRSVTFTFNLHRELLSNIDITPNSFGLEDNEKIIEELVNTIQAAALPKYTSTSKMINPPIVAVRIGDQIYIKGVISGSVSVTYSLPIVDNKYSRCEISFTVNEIDPYDAESVRTIGSFRGLSKDIEKRVKVGI